MKQKDSSKNAVSNEVRIIMLENKKSGLGAAGFLIVAVPSGILAGLGAALAGGAYWAIPVIIGLIVLQVYLFYILVKKWRAINAEIRSLE